MKGQFQPGKMPGNDFPYSCLLNQNETVTRFTLRQIVQFQGTNLEIKLHENKRPYF